MNWFWKWICRITGVQEEFCKLRHGRHHTLKQIGYGGEYLAHCSKCGSTFTVRR